MIDLIQEKYDITAMEMINFTRPNAEEFYELYRGVVQDYYVRYIPLLCKLSTFSIVAGQVL